MAKAILTVEIPEDCYKVTADIRCYTPYQVYAHEQELEGYDIGLRKDAYEIFQEKVSELLEKYEKEDEE